MNSSLLPSLNASLVHNISNGTQDYWHGGYLFDCNHDGPEILLYTIESAIAVCGVILFVYCSLKLWQTKVLKIKYKLLVTVCNVSLTFSMCMCLIFSFMWLTQDCEQIQESIWWEWKFASMMLQTPYLFGYNLIYIIFYQRLKDGLKDSIFELSKKSRLFFILSSTIMIILVMNDILFRLMIHHPHWFDLNVDTSDDNTQFFSEEQYFIMDHLLYPNLFLFLGISTINSNIAICIFVSRFKLILSCARRSSISNHNQQVRYEKYLQVLSRTSLLVSIALMSSIISVLLSTVWNVFFFQNVYTYEYINVIIGGDAIINMFCVNLQYQHGYKIYKFLMCEKWELQLQKCVQHDKSFKIFLVFIVFSVWAALVYEIMMFHM